MKNTSEGPDLGFEGSPRCGHTTRIQPKNSIWPYSRFGHTAKIWPRYVAGSVTNRRCLFRQIMPAMSNGPKPGMKRLIEDKFWNQFLDVAIQPEEKGKIWPKAGKIVDWTWHERERERERKHCCNNSAGTFRRNPNWPSLGRAKRWVSALPPSSKIAD